MTVTEISRFRPAVELLGLAGIEAAQEHLGGGIFGIRVEYDGTPFYALITESEEGSGTGYALGFYMGDVGEPIEYHAQLRLSQVITRLKGMEWADREESE